MPLVLDMMRSCNPSDIVVSAVVEAELRLGALKSAHPVENEAKVELFLVPFKRVPFDSSAASAYARIRADLERKGTPIGPNDLLIAATAVACGATLVTGNVREFERVKDLRVENWAEVRI